MSISTRNLKKNWRQMAVFGAAVSSEFLFVIHKSICYAQISRAGIFKAEFLRWFKKVEKLTVATISKSKKILVNHLLHLITGTRKT